MNRSETDFLLSLQERSFLSVEHRYHLYVFDFLSTGTCYMMGHLLHPAHSFKSHFGGHDEEVIHECTDLAPTRQSYTLNTRQQRVCPFRPIEVSANKGPLYNTAMGAIRPHYRFVAKNGPTNYNASIAVTLLRNFYVQPCFWNVADRPVASPRRFPFFSSHRRDFFSR